MNFSDSVRVLNVSRLSTPQMKEKPLFEVCQRKKLKKWYIQLGLEKSRWILLLVSTTQYCQFNKLVIFFIVCGDRLGKSNPIIRDSYRRFDL